MSGQEEWERRKGIEGEWEGRGEEIQHSTAFPLYQAITKSLKISNNNNNFNDNRGQEGPIVKIRRIILTGVLYVGYSMHS